MPGGKSPPLVKWKAYQETVPTANDYRTWFADTHHNIAILTGDIIVADVDEPSLLGLVMEKCGETDVISKTPGGGYHLWYRKRRGAEIGNRVDVRGHDFDLRASGGYAMVPPSRTEDGLYEWLGLGLREISSLPVFKVSWTRERVRRTFRPIERAGEPAEAAHHGLVRTLPTSKGPSPGSAGTTAPCTLPGFSFRNST